MRQFLIAAAAACMLAACGAGADGPPLPRVQAGATPPSTQSPGSPTQQTTSQYAAGSNTVGNDTIVPMQPGHDHRVVIDLVGGQQYGFIGACDGDCTNVDIELISMTTGGVVANDMLPDDFPIATYRPEANGQYMVRLLMQACTQSPCYAGFRVISDTPQANAQAPAPQAPSGTDAPAGAGGTPGKP
ncbi:MAG: hypothetical protein ABL932_05780 [Terricaulis sp.]